MNSFLQLIKKKRNVSKINAPAWVSLLFLLMHMWSFYYLLLFLLKDYFRFFLASWL